MRSQELIALPKGTRVKPKEVFKDVQNYIHRADKVSGLRRQLIQQAKLGRFRMVGDDEWERM